MAKKYEQWYSVFMNIILFENTEIGKPLSRRDERTIHLLKVLRKKAGDTFEAGLLGGNRGLGCIDSVRIDGSILYSLDLRDEPPGRYPIRVAVGFPRPIQIKRILRDLSSLGVSAIDLVATELGEKSYQNTKLLMDGGARTALIEGAIQARDTSVPDLAVYSSLQDWLSQSPWEKPSGDSGKSFTRSPYSISAPLLIALDHVRPEGSLSHLSAMGQAMVLAVGSERGWSDRERDEMEKAGFIRLSMGSRALRTETACVAAGILALEKIGVLS